MRRRENPEGEDKVIPLRAPTRKLRSSEVSAMMDAAQSREEDPIWAELESCLKRLDHRHHFRCKQVRTHIEWLRKQAAHQGRSWGLK